MVGIGFGAKPPFFLLLEVRFVAILDSLLLVLRMLSLVAVRWISSGLREVPALMEAVDC